MVAFILNWQWADGTDWNKTSSATQIANQRLAQRRHQDTDMAGRERAQKGKGGKREARGRGQWWNWCGGARWDGLVNQRRWDGWADGRTEDGMTGGLAGWMVGCCLSVPAAARGVWRVGDAVR